ncbi:MAG: phage terminase large subunit [Phycisphaerae bacterium]|nr:phage terminase large subunit [Phycisphaerae bacterium]
MTIANAGALCTAGRPDFGIMQLRLAAAHEGRRTEELLSKQRRRMAAQSPFVFAKLYLANHFKLPPSRMHRELFQLLENLKEQRGRRIAIAAPRGHAKTTVVGLAYILWCALYNLEPMIVVVSNASSQAIQILRHIKEELLHNELLHRDFPEICSVFGTGKGPRPCTNDQITLPNGVAIRAFGSEQRMRGLRQRQFRPSLIVVDDLEEQEGVLSSEGREKTREWFAGTLLKLGNNETNVVVVGTVLHYDSLLASLTGVPGAKAVSGWDAKVYRALEQPSLRPELWEKWEAIYSGLEEFPSAEPPKPATNKPVAQAHRVGAGIAAPSPENSSSGNSAECLAHTGPAAAKAFYEEKKSAMLEGTQVLWPELDDYHTLMVTRVREGRTSFQAEKQNQPIDPSECIFRDEIIRYWDDDFASPAALAEHFRGKCVIAGACDPSLGGRSGRGDYSAIVTLLRPSNSKIVYVLDASLSLSTPDQTIGRIVEQARLYKYTYFYLESNGFQELMLKQLKERASAASVSLPVRSVNHRTDKRARIQALEPMISQGHLLFSRKQQMLIEQLRQFPMAAHDDGPDALEMAVMALNTPRPSITVASIDRPFW